MFRRGRQVIKPVGILPTRRHPARSGRAGQPVGVLSSVRNPAFQRLEKRLQLGEITGHIQVSLEVINLPDKILPGARIERFRREAGRAFLQTCPERLIR